MPMTPTILIIPGLRDHVEAHWQTYLAKELPNCVTVPPLEQDKLSCQARLDAIDRALDSIDGPVLIVAHSAGLGCGSQTCTSRFALSALKIIR